MSNISGINKNGNNTIVLIKINDKYLSIENEEFIKSSEIVKKEIREIKELEQ